MTDRVRSHAVLAATNEARIISYGLYGDDARYTIGVLRNAQLAPVVYPGWKVRGGHASTTLCTLPFAIRLRFRLSRLLAWSIPCLLACRLFGMFVSLPLGASLLRSHGPTSCRDSAREARRPVGASALDNRRQTHHGSLKTLC